MGVRPKQILLRCAHWTAFTTEWASELRCACLWFGLDSGCVCHTRLGPSRMTEHSEAGLGMHVVQGRKQPTDAKEERARERTDVSEKDSSGSYVMYQVVTCNWLWFVESSPPVMWQLVSRQSLSPIQTCWIRICIRQDPRGFLCTVRVERYWCNLFLLASVRTLSVTRIKI